MLDFIFWFSILFIFYTYFGYPLLLFLLAKFRSRPVHSARYNKLSHGVNKRIMLEYDGRTTTDGQEIARKDYGVSTIDYPSVTLLIAAHNEEKVIRGK